MTTDISMQSTGQDPVQATRKSSGGKSPRKKPPAGGEAAKRGKTAAARRASASAGSRKSSGSSGGIAARVLSRGRKAAGSAYDWAAEGASRAIPLASRSMPDQRTVQRLVDERPYMLGALGLGIGAMIGLMLPSPLHAVSRPSPRRNGRSGR